VLGGKTGISDAVHVLTEELVTTMYLTRKDVVYFLQPYEFKVLSHFPVFYIGRQIYGV
jgi:hypothetical protein